MEIASEQLFTGMLNAVEPNRRLVIVSNCVIDVRPVAPTVIVGVPIVVSSKKKLVVLLPAVIVAAVI